MSYGINKINANVKVFPLNKSIYEAKQMYPRLGLTFFSKKTLGESTKVKGVKFLPSASSFKSLASSRDVSLGGSLWFNQKAEIP